MGFCSVGKMGLVGVVCGGLSTTRALVPGLEMERKALSQRVGQGQGRGCERFLFPSNPSFRIHRICDSWSVIGVLSSLEVLNAQPCFNPISFPQSAPSAVLMQNHTMGANPPAFLSVWVQGWRPTEGPVCARRVG